MARRRKDICRAGGGGGESLKPRTAIAGAFSAWGGLGELDRGLGRGEPFFPDSDSDETFQISRKLGLVHVEFFSVLVQQFCLQVPVPTHLLSAAPGSTDTCPTYL